MSKVLFVIEPLGIEGKEDSALLVKEALARGFECHATRIDKISLKNGNVTAECHRAITAYEETPETESIDVSNFNFVVIRWNPPFDMQYFTAMRLLAMLPKTTLVSNNPKAICDLPEKIFPLMYKDFSPPTLLSSDQAQIQDFITEHRKVIIKPLYDFGGNGIQVISKGEKLSEFTEMVVVQKYLPEVLEGNKRILLVDGEFVGAVLYIRLEGETGWGLHAKSRFEKSELTPREAAICEELKPILKSEGLHICGLDSINSYLTEINTTSPSGFITLTKTSNIEVEKIFWDKLLKA